MKTIMYDGQKIAPSKIVCVGRNYVEHIKELGNEIPSELIIFLKPNSSLSETLHSFHHEPVHYEGELSFLCEGGRFTAVGFGLDLTKRELQTRLIADGLPWERCKAFDGSAVFSSFVPFNGDFSTLYITLEINGITVQSGGSELMLYKPDEILNEISQFMSLNDGDIIMTGTPKGVGIINAADRFDGYVKQDNNVIVHGAWLAE